MINAKNNNMEDKYTFQTESIHYQVIEEKGKDKQYFVSGYISTSDLDLYNDIVTKKGMESMLNQITTKNITLDYDHEAWRDNPTILPVGKITEAKIDDRGLWVKCKLNKSSPKFKALWGSIKDGFVNAFSIAFKPVKIAEKMVGDVKARLLDDLKLLNVALTGVPVNEGAVMTGCDMKSVVLKSIEKLEENKMSEDEVKPEAEAKEEVKEEAQEETKEEAPAEEVKEEAPAEEVKEEAPAESVEEKAIEALTKEIKSMAKKMEETNKEIKSIKDKAVFKSKTPEPVEQKAVEDNRTALDFC